MTQIKTSTDAEIIKNIYENWMEWDQQIMGKPKFENADKQNGTSCFKGLKLLHYTMWVSSFTQNKAVKLSSCILTWKRMNL